MGLFDTNQSTSNYTQNTTVDTKTTTKVGDIGLSGQNAVDLAKVLGATFSDMSRNEAASYQVFAGAGSKNVSDALNASSGALTTAYSALDKSGSQTATVSKLGVVVVLVFATAMVLRLKK